MSAPINLHSRPVYGYEYSSCNANERRVRDMRNNPAFQANSDAELEQFATISYIASNIFNVLGAFVPLVGAGRIIVALSRNDEQSLKEGLRGLAELLGAGLFMIAIDVAVTIHREYSVYQARNQYVII